MSLFFFENSYIQYIPEVVSRMSSLLVDCNWLFCGPGLPAQPIVAMVACPWKTGKNPPHESAKLTPMCVFGCLWRRKTHEKEFRWF